MAELIDQISRLCFPRSTTARLTGRCSWFCDGVWRVTLDDPHNGIDAEAVVDSIGEAVEWFRTNAVKLYPDSTFALKYARGFE